MYNVALYNIRQQYILNKTYVPYKDNYHLCKDNENYKLLNTDIAQQTLKNVDEAMKAFFSLLKLKKEGKYQEHVRLPGYLEKDGLFIITFPIRDCYIKVDGTMQIPLSNRFKKDNSIKENCLRFKIPERINDKPLKEVSIVPVHDGKAFKINYVYDDEPVNAELDYNQYMSIDLGLGNFATIIESVSGTATIIDGKYVKSINRYWNKENARLQSIKDLQRLME